MNTHELYEDFVWDVVVIGTGIGGATTGFHLAKQGKKVLFMEKGKQYDHNPEACCDNFAETFVKEGASGKEIQSIYKNAGRWTAAFYDKSGRDKSFVPFIGSGAGGSSALYGGAMERFFPEDFSCGQYHDDPGSSLPDQWPISYEDLKPYYQQAETLYRVLGSPDPLRPDTRFSYKTPEGMLPASRELFDFFSTQGFHPYRLPIAYDTGTECAGCQGFLCSFRCKNDSSKICLEPAVDQYGARIMDECEVIEFQGTQDAVQNIICRKAGRVFKIRAAQFVLSAGAVMSPLILLNSKNASWPDGLGNRSGRVGRNLMRHHIDLYAVYTKSTGLPGNKKEIAFNDLYVSGSQKFGTVQSFGALPPAHVLAAEIRQDIKKNISSVLAFGFSLAKPLVAMILHRMLASTVILASIKEDLPYPENRVQLGNVPGETVIPVLQYHLSDYEKQGIKEFRQRVKNILKPYKIRLLKQSENIERIAHACGTCRFGDDPEKSVLDRYNQVHGMDNLFVVDSSFFPSSGGTNPSLTIAANALRVADYILSTR